LCLKLFLLNIMHHFHLTYINRPFFLVVHVDLILNSRLWVCPSRPRAPTRPPTPKVLRINARAPTFFFFVSFWDPLLGLLKSLGAHQSKRVSSQTYLEIVMKFVSYLSNYWRWLSCNEIGLLLFYKFSFS
jgi:hypothetical protein